MAVDVGLIGLLSGAGIIAGTAWITRSIELAAIGGAAGIVYIGLEIESGLLYQSAWLILGLTATAFGLAILRELI